jgi:fucose permease
MVSLFWVMITLGRVVLGAAAVRVGVERLLRLAMLGVLLSTALLVVRAASVGFVALALMGLSLSSIFPTLTAHTPNRVGVDHAANAIGFQTGAASIGLALLPGLAGFLAARVGLESLGPFLVVGALLMLAINQAAAWLSRRERVVAEKAAVGSATH